MANSSVYTRRVNSLIADEDYGPALARLGREDTGQVLLLVQAGDMRGARREILRRDAERRAAETARRDRRRRQSVMSHIQRELRDAALNYNQATVAFGVSLMTRGEVETTLAMDAAEIQDAAADPTNIKMYMMSTVEHNVWWYH